MKESRAPVEDYPDWGDLEQRCAYWETATAMSLLVTGAELLIMYHPKAAETVKKSIEEMYASRNVG